MSVLQERFAHSQETGEPSQFFGPESSTITYIYMHITSLVVVKFSFLLGHFLSGFPTKLHY